MRDGGSRPGTSIHCQSILWKRFDFRESSRIVTLLTRDHGRVQALAKGAHRADSPLLGRLDFLNELHIRLSADRGGLRLLLSAELLRERRSLRQPDRFLAASYLAELFDFGLPSERPDPPLFDLVQGGLNLLELCPLWAIAPVILGLEVRFLQQLGALPDLEHCGHCGLPLGATACRGEDAGSLACRRHAPAPRQTVGREALHCLQQLRDLPGRQWPELPRVPAAATALTAAWLAAALDRRSHLRTLVLRRAGASRRQRQRAVDNGA